MIAQMFISVLAEKFCKSSQPVKSSQLRHQQLMPWAITALPCAFYPLALHRSAISKVANLKQLCNTLVILPLHEVELQIDITQILQF